ncbi:MULTISPECIES: DUF2628 domain-containing protein [Gordonia]|uniref:DUF2628 domain-containing protein n=1 Tax=Gordonia amicalis TaxID=89053 RepID=A0AAE4U533_9ACTN|nr:MULTISPECIES: DUF2628 domain-containing protein [Gordonia]ATD72817.1 DUF2628 domain-containing protein [Gordonia sp. 1D]KAF0968869.1 hypothetical protein BPODLACK_02524 [Gordonia sp. YY1]MBA5846213.1 DUF2628 domain-containing protein [Gordonia amicalis]MCZ4579452.1 DUF2628 domain-containing protein [Gordonia amicalis]MDJ0452043.1 DUF2628 domain-containing protein [Gordonia amicalis]
MTFSEQPLRDHAVPPSWHSRFAFFDAYGPPADPPSREAMKHLPFGQRVRITFNPLAFFFGPIYFAVKGMWRKGLMLFGLTLVFNALLLALNVPSSFDMAIACGVGALYATTANYAWYLHVRNDNRSWNIFEGTTRSKG